MNELALFAGAGGGILGGKLLGWRTVCAVEINDYCRRVLMQRQCDGILNPFPIWDDVRTFDGKPWRGIIDVVSGGFPCQDISGANPNGEGIDGKRSGLWREFARIIREAGPEWVWVENSPVLSVRGLGTVLGDLADLGFNAQWGVLGARHAGAFHKRDRMWILGANANGNRLEGRALTNPSQGRHSNHQRISPLVPRISWPDVSNPHAYGSNHGLANRVERTRAIGNGQVPAVVRLAWETLTAQRDML